MDSIESIPPTWKGEVGLAWDWAEEKTASRVRQVLFGGGEAKEKTATNSINSKSPPSLEGKHLERGADRQRRITGETGKVQDATDMVEKIS